MAKTGRQRGTWGLPGGAIELDGSAVKALVREFYRRNWVKVTVKKLLNVYTKYSDSYQMVMRHKLLQCCI